MDGSASFNPKPGVAEDIAKGVRRIVAPNASPMTFKGTNTYLVGNRDIAVIDPGPPDEAHLDAIMSALQGHQRISHVVVTHSHIDHSPLAMVLAQFTGAKVHGFGPSSAGRATVMADLKQLGGGEGIDETFMPDVLVPHLGLINGRDWQLRALHTPGHMGNHLCFELDWDGVFSGHVFSGDHIMGWATSMVSPPDGHLTDFMLSLRLMMEREGHETYHPGHGAPISAPHDRARELFDHRKSREGQILAALGTSPASAVELATQIYTDVDPRLLPAATRNVLAHLIDLNARGITMSNGPLTEDAQFSVA